jgi:hypothetical protein
MRLSVLGSAGIGIALFVAYLGMHRDSMVYSRLFISDVRKTVASGASAYAFDGSGYLGWMLSDHMRIIDGDGLVNSFEYYESVLQTCAMDEFFREHSVGYYIHTSVGAENCPLACYCLSPGRYHRVAASQSTTDLLAYKLYSMQN